LIDRLGLKITRGVAAICVVGEKTPQNGMQRFLLRTNTNYGKKLNKQRGM
jgi:hypothetical protein